MRALSTIRLHYVWLIVVCVSGELTQEQRGRTQAHARKPDSITPALGSLYGLTMLIPRGVSLG